MRGHKQIATLLCGWCYVINHQWAIYPRNTYYHSQLAVIVDHYPPIRVNNRSESHTNIHHVDRDTISPDIVFPGGCCHHQVLVVVSAWRDPRLFTSRHDPALVHVLGEANNHPWTWDEIGGARHIPIVVDPRFLLLIITFYQPLTNINQLIKH